MKLFVIVVLYKVSPAKSPTLRSLAAAVRVAGRENIQLSVLVWDNSPEQQDARDIPLTVCYHAAPDNPGLAAAYNEAIAMAAAEGFDWLLTLDQDTTLPLNFLTLLSARCNELSAREEIAAIVPRVIGHGRSLSPFQFKLKSIPLTLRDHASGVSREPVYAFNSAATFRISSLQEIAGYNTLFPLDVSDLDLFHRLQAAAKRIFFDADSVVSHDFSLLNKLKKISVERYTAQLRDECAFWDMNLPFAARLERMLRLLFRSVKESIDPEDRPLRSVTLKELRRRLFTRRQDRLTGWHQEAHARADRNNFPRLASFRPKVNHVETDHVSDYGSLSYR